MGNLTRNGPLVFVQDHRETPQWTNDPVPEAPNAGTAGSVDDGDEEST
jgi:hypothetical protein